MGCGGLFPSMAKPERLLPAPRQGINCIHMGQYARRFYEDRSLQHETLLPQKSPGHTKALIFHVLPTPSLPPTA